MTNESLRQQVTSRADVGQADGWSPELPAEPSPRFPPSISQDRPSPEIVKASITSWTPPLPFLGDGFRTFPLFGMSLWKAYQNSTQGVSLVVQWIDICLPTRGTWVPSLVQEASSRRGATKPMGHSSWVHVLRLLKPVCLEPVLSRKRSRHCGKPMHHSEERPPLAQREEATPGDEDPAELLINKSLLFYNSPWCPSLCCVTQLPPTLCDPMDCSPPGSSVQGVLQARILQWVAMPSSRGSSQLRDWTQSPTLQADSLPSEPPGKAWWYCPSLKVPLWGDGHIPSFKPAPCSGCPQKSFPIMEFLYSSFFYFFYLLSLNLSTRSHLSKFPKPWTLRAQGHFVAGCRQWTLTDELNQAPFVWNKSKHEFGFFF